MREPIPCPHWCTGKCADTWHHFGEVFAYGNFADPRAVRIYASRWSEGYGVIRTDLCLAVGEGKLARFRWQDAEDWARVFEAIGAPEYIARGIREAAETVGEDSP